MAVTNLTNTKWKWNDTISYSGTLDRIFTLNFTSNNTAYVNIGISYSSMSNIVNYNKSSGLVTMAQSNNSWENEAYKEFEVSGGSDATNTDLINFITSNATQVMDNPVFKRVSGEWVKQNAYRFINGSWVKVSEADAPPVQWVFGVSGLNSSTPQLTRTDDAVGKTWSMDSSTGLITTGFDTFFNFERITDSSGNIFARIPKMYQSFSGGDTLKIANYKVDDTFNLYPSFLGENGEELDYFDYGCYKASTNGSKLSSRSGVTPTYWKIISEFRTEARANSETNYLYFQKDIRARQLIQDLFMVVFATRNTEDVQGTSWKEYGSNTGDTDSITNDTLSNPLMCCGLNQTTKGFKLFGIEDICGNGWEFVDGIYFSSASIYISYRPSQFADSTSNKIRLSYSRPTSSNYISKLGYDASNPCINYPVATSGSPSTYYCDKVWYNSSGTILYDGAASFSANDGVWYASGDYDASRSRVNIGSRLCRQPA